MINKFQAATDVQSDWIHSLRFNRSLLRQGEYKELKSLHEKSKFSALEAYNGDKNVTYSYIGMFFTQIRCMKRPLFVLATWVNHPLYKRMDVAA